MHPSIVNDVRILLRERSKLCPACFAVQLGCHADCWGMKTVQTSAGDVARMEPGNMGVVYSRDRWAWFQSTLLYDFCSTYGIWDVMLHHHLFYKGAFVHALTFIKSRIMHVSACTSDRVSAGNGVCDQMQLHRIQQDFSQQDNHIDGNLVDRGMASLPEFRIHDLHSIKADVETYQRCLMSAMVNETLRPESTYVVHAGSMGRRDLNISTRGIVG